MGSSVLAPSLIGEETDIQEGGIKSFCERAGTETVGPSPSFQPDPYQTLGELVTITHMIRKKEGRVREQNGPQRGHTWTPGLQMWSHTWTCSLQMRLPRICTPRPQTGACLLCFPSRLLTQSRGTAWNRKTGDLDLMVKK